MYEARKLHNLRNTSNSLTLGYTKVPVKDFDASTDNSHPLSVHSQRILSTGTTLIPLCLSKRLCDRSLHIHARERTKHVVHERPALNDLSRPCHHQPDSCLKPCTTAECTAVFKHALRSEGVDGSPKFDCRETTVDPTAHGLTPWVTSNPTQISLTPMKHNRSLLLHPKS